MPNQITCNKFNEQLSSHFYGSLDSIEEIRLLYHGKECLKCRRLMTDYFCEKTEKEGLGWIASQDNHKPQCLSDSTINEYGEGKLTDDEKKIVRDHIEECFLCQDLVNGYIEHIKKKSP